MLDIKIVGGTIVDGTGTPRFAGDVGIRGGRMVAIGQVAEPAHEVIDARGLLVVPGFIDCHTHYDAQVFWDPALSPSCFHGVTTVVGGFCGFSIAPMTPDAAGYIRPMLARVEGMPLETLEAAVPWNAWSSFGEFLAAIDGRAGLNVGFFCGHSTLRRIAMGARAVGEIATGDEVATMKALLAASLEEGALGFSTTISPTHSDADGNPVPSRWADFSEILELAGEVRHHEGTGLELLPDLEFDPRVVQLMIDVSLAGDRPVNWNALAVTGRDPAAYTARAESMLRVSDAARGRGAEIIALTIPAAPVIYMNLRNGVGFDSLPGLWWTIFKLPLPERMARFADPAVRSQLAADAATVPDSSPFAFKVRFADYLVTGPGDANQALRSRRISEIAAERGQAALDTLLDIALADELATIFAPDTAAEDRTAYELRAKLWRDDRTLIGASDAGAHLDMIDTFAFSTTTLQRGVREHGVINLEEAVHLMTDRIARYFGLIDRGRIAPSFHADIAIIDEDRVARGPAYLRPDVPGGAARIYAEAEGVPHVIVNGVRIVRDGEHTGALPGTVLRSGRDTRTTPIGALRNAPAVA